MIIESVNIHKISVQIPFPEELPVNRDTILQFAADYLSGKLRSQADAAEMAKRALQVDFNLPFRVHIRHI